MSYVTLRLVGPHAGKNITLNGQDFVKGECVLRGDPRLLAHTVRYFGNCYSAFPVGTTELLQAERAYLEAIGGTVPVHSESTSLERPGGLGGELQRGVGLDAEAPDADGRRDGAADVRPDRGPALRGGHGHSGILPDPKPALASYEVAVNETLRAAILKLDPHADDHWTQDGRPSVLALESILSSGGFTSQDVEASSPGWDRTQALAKYEADQLAAMLAPPKPQKWT